MISLNTIKSPREATLEHTDPIEGMRQLARLVRAEYVEMPGLSVTLPQAQRLWRVDEQTCRGVLDALVARGILRRTDKGCYVRVRA